MNNYNPDLHHRRSIRLKGYDYSKSGLYFVTICFNNRLCLFGAIDNSINALNEAGEMVVSEWIALPNRFSHVYLHEYVVMPNHFHAVIEIEIKSDLIEQFILNLI